MTEIFLKASAESGAAVHQWVILSTDKLIFSPDLLEYCKTNTCGNYGKSWTCPPACANMEEQKQKILDFRNALVFTTKHELEDSFDYEGMTKGRELHTQLTIEVAKQLDNPLIYGAGGCPLCINEEGNNICHYPLPCPYPEKQIGSIEAAGINVTELSKAAGFNYNNGPNTVTFFSMALY